MMFLHFLRVWQPFRIDALGLVTIFGADTMNTAIGRLLQNPFTDWLPVLGAYIMATNEFAAPKQGFVLYNITDGLMATDVCAWFTRWLLSYPLTYSATTVRLRIDGRQMPNSDRVQALVLGCLATFPSLVMAGLMEDWWDLANVLAMMTSVAVRQAMTGQLRSWIDEEIDGFGDDPGDVVKVFLTLPTGKAVTIYGPRSVIVNCILTDPRPRRKRLYWLLRGVGWAAFGVHVIALGMATLWSQLLTVLVLLVGTVLTATDVGTRMCAVGRRLCMDVDLGDATWYRPRVYARLALSKTEEEYMVRWSLFPQRENEFWWNKYRQKEAAFKAGLAAREADEKGEAQAAASQV